ncbi:zinc finger MYND domain-containing protein 11-like [Diaphorina citri]|uniref:Zinc finger MYND domain-containing protein 11-like n=1 Tax=Diaphorina citri TaxID=121845 RepID=A0A1S4ENU9_DIACI|nr:zinc finger MYND domain-containing protein 11-like [Diaphorina citri]
MIERRLNEGAYRSVDTLYEDVKWMVHNSVIFNGGTSAITKDLRYLLKNLRMELYDLDSCACCYIHAYTRPELWFILPCPSPHLLVWAQLKGANE